MTEIQLGTDDFEKSRFIMIFLTILVVKKIIMNLDLSKSSGTDSIPVVVLKKCEPQLSYMLAELFNKYLKESCFPDCWKVSLVVPVCMKGLQLKTTTLLVFFLRLVKSLENL